MTRQMTPMHEPANMPWDVLCQLLLRKPVWVNDRFIVWVGRNNGRPKTRKTTQNSFEDVELTRINRVPVPQHGNLACAGSHAHVVHGHAGGHTHSGGGGWCHACHGHVGGHGHGGRGAHVHFPDGYRFAVYTSMTLFSDRTLN